MVRKNNLLLAKLKFRCDIYIGPWYCKRINTLNESLPKKKFSLVLGSNKYPFSRCIVAACVAQVIDPSNCYTILLCVTFDHTFGKPARNDNRI